LFAAPLYHKNALNAIKQGLTAGATLVLMPQFNVEHYIAAIERFHCTVISGVPTMISMLLARKELLSNTDTTSVRTVMMGSAPSSPQLLADIRVHFPNAEPLVVYGVTEEESHHEGEREWWSNCPWSPCRVHRCASHHDCTART